MSRVIATEEVKKHNNEKSVWMIIHNEVYDVTNFLDEHPGGPESLLDYAGKDGTQAFEDVAHSEDARELMKKYKIGKLPPEEETKPVIPCCPKLAKSRSPKGGPSGKSWRTFDGSTDSAKRRETSSKFHEKCVPVVERRVQTVVVPRESSRLKWALVALAGAIVIGVVMKKYMT